MKLLLRAALFALILNLPNLAYLGSSGSSFNIYNDPDEIAYLRRTLEIGRGLSANSYYDELAEPVSVGMQLSELLYAPIDLLAGRTAAAAGFDVVELGLACDLLLCFLSYLAFTALFRTVIDRQLAAEFAAFCALAAPYSLVFYRQLRLFPEVLTENILNPAPAFTPGLPVLRGVYTQFSYPLLALALALLLKALYRGRPRLIIYSSFLCGALSYTYLYGWLTCLFISGCLILLHAELNREGWKKIFSVSRQFGLVQLLCLVPRPLLQLLNPVSLSTLIPTPEIRSYWYFSPEVAIPAAILLCCLRRVRPSMSLHAPLALLTALLAGQIVLYNLQPLSGCFIAVFHFTDYYLHPLFTGTVALLAAAYIRSEWTKYLRYTCWAGAAVWFYLQSTTAWAHLKYLENPAETSQLTHYLAHSTEPDSVVALISFSEPFEQHKIGGHSWRSFPNGVTTMADRRILHQGWMTPTKESAEVYLKRELFLGWLYTGRMQMSAECPVQSIEFPGDLFTMVRTYSRVLRKNYCTDIGQVMAAATACDLIKSFRLDYLIWESEFKRELPPALLEVLQLTWESPQGSYRVYRFDKAAALNKFCAL